MAENSRIVPINIEDEMKSAYIDYSMSVIVARALPDVRDGLKPVHRRVLYGMHELGLIYNKAHKKSARIVGEVLGKYHPHGDGSVYDSMVRMAQHWSLRYPLVDGQGNFGSVDGDSPAAMRYTEARLRRISDELIQDIDRDTVDFRFNFDDSLEEPSVLPAKFPHLLVNGASGIAVGMATNMLPHNLTEVIDGTIAYIDNEEITIPELGEHIKGPDFPTGGTIYGVQGIGDYQESGRGRIVVRGKAEIETRPNGKEVIIISEIPYQINKSVMIMKIADMVNSGKLTGISNIRDESDRKGMRVVVEVKRDAMANVVLSSLYKYSQLQTSYGVNNIALVNGRPVLLSIKQIISEFVKFRIEVITRRTEYLLKKAEERAHILEGLLIALDNLDAVIALIRNSKTPDEAQAGLVSNFDLTDIQAKAILEMRLQRLTGLERDKIRKEYDELQKKIDHYKAILSSTEMKKDIIKEELRDIQERFGDERRTDIVAAEGEINIEDMIADEDMVITMSHLGYIKRTNLAEYRTQGRGGKGSKGSKTRDKDFIEHVFSASAHEYLLFFTDKGRCHWLRAYQIPEATKNSTGRVVQNIMQIPKEDKVKTIIKVRDLKDDELLDNNFIIFCTRKGMVKKTALRLFARPRANGINAITIKEGDELLDARLTSGKNEIVLGVASGYAIRFPEEKVRPMGRTAAGVRGIRLQNDDDAVVGMVSADPADMNASILVVSQKGLGKRTLLSEYRLTNRGGKGVKTLQVTEKTGKLISIKGVTDNDELMITNKSGITIRTGLDAIRNMGRATQGVRIINLKEDDEISDIALVPISSSDEEE